MKQSNKTKAADQGNQPLNPTSDIFVRYLLGAEKNTGLLIHFINAVFERKGTPRVVELEIRNPST
mgnify:FL=1